MQDAHLQKTDQHKLSPKDLTHQSFSHHLFWDVDRTKIDFVKNKGWVIERVLSPGMLSDWYVVKEYYGKSTIRKTALQLRYLDKRSLHFCAAYFNVPIDKFRCYTYAQLNPAHWDY